MVTFQVVAVRGEGATPDHDANHGRTSVYIRYFAAGQDGQDSRGKESYREKKKRKRT
jgi:hypothetical protein